MGLELCSILIIAFTRARGLITLSMGRAMRNSPMEPFTQGPMLMANQRAMEHTHGKMVKPMRGNG